MYGPWVQAPCHLSPTRAVGDGVLTFLWHVFGLLTQHFPVGFTGSQGQPRRLHRCKLHVSRVTRCLVSPVCAVLTCCFVFFYSNVRSSKASRINAVSTRFLPSPTRVDAFAQLLCGLPFPLFPLQPAAMVSLPPWVGLVLRKERPFPGSEVGLCHPFPQGPWSVLSSPRSSPLPWTPQRASPRTSSAACVTWS